MFAWGTLLGMDRDLPPEMKERTFSFREACVSGLPPNTNLWLGTALVGDPRLLLLPTLFERRESY